MIRPRNGQYNSTSWKAFTIAAGLLLAAVSAPVVPAADAGRPPARLVPSRGLYCYAEYDGLDAQTDAWKATAASAMLAQTGAGEMISDVLRQVLDRMFKMVPRANLNGSDLVALEDFIVHHGFALALYTEEGKTSSVIVLKAFGEKENGEHFERLRRLVLQIGNCDKPPAPTQFRGRTLFQLGDQTDAAPKAGTEGGPLEVFALSRMSAAGPPPSRATWWFEGNDLIIVWGPNAGFPFATGNDLGARHKARVTAVLDAIEGKQLNVSSHPTYLAACREGRDIKAFEPNGLCFAEVSEGQTGIIELLPSPMNISQDQSMEHAMLRTLGLDRARRVVARWGFRGKALLTDFRFEASQPWRGVGGLLDPAGFRKESVPPIPSGAGAFAIGSFRHGDANQLFAPLTGALKPEYRAIFEAAEKAAGEAIGQRLRDDLLRHLGPTWCVYADSGAKPGATGSTVPTFLIEVKNAEELDKLLTTLASRVNAYVRDQIEGAAGQGENGQRPVMAFERLQLPDRGYRLSSPAGTVPWLGADMQPTVMLGKSFLVAAATPALARAAIKAESSSAGRWSPDGELRKSLECLPERLSLLSVGNTHDSFWPKAIASLPDTAEPFLCQFIGLPLSDAQDDAAPDLLALLGVPKRSRSGIRIERAKMPTAEELSAHLFPSIVAATVDERSFRVLSVEAFPFACVGLEAKYEKGGLAPNLAIDVKFRSGN